MTRNFDQAYGDVVASPLPGKFKIAFPQPVFGPLACDYAAHFGLGLFVPVRDEKQ